MAISRRPAQGRLMAEPRAPRELEFILLVALSTSLVAMSIDSMLPALGDMATELGARAPNDRQLILTAFFAGLTVGQPFYGILSDSTGRKPAMIAGTLLFIIGGLMCAWTQSFGLLLLGRTLQGFGAAGPRVVAVAIVRDVHAGAAMARVMSFVSSVFILVPILAPSFGQGVLLIASWRAIFWALVVIATFNLLWFAVRQPETLIGSKRSRFSPGPIFQAAAFTFRSRVTVGYMLASGFIFGSFLNYLSTAQQIFQEQYDLGRWFPLLFGALAAGIGVASLVNAKLVLRFGPRALCRWAATTVAGVSFVFLAYAWSQGGHPPITAFMAYMLLCFFGNGVLFGNYSARAMEPMGHVAGVAAAIIGSGSSLLALVVSTPFGRAYDGTVIPLVFAFALLSAAALLVTEYAEAPGRAKN